MAYVSPNFKTKKSLKLAIAAGDPVRVVQPALGTIPENGIVCLQGPHWYAAGTMKNGKLVKVVALLLSLLLASSAQAGGVYASHEPFLDMVGTIPSCLPSPWGC